jgi:membrane dipeptidase
MPRSLSLLLALLATAGSVAAAQEDPNLARAKAVLERYPLIDGHNDLPWAIREYDDAPHDVQAYDITRRTPGHTDIARLRQGMVGAQFWSVYIPSDLQPDEFVRVQLEQIDIARQVIDAYPETFALAGTADDVERIFREGKIASLLGVEGGHAIANSLGVLRTYYDLGARYMTLTHWQTLDWVDAATDEPRHDGLTAYGEAVVREMNWLGMLVDLSHVSDATMSDALDVSEAPVIFSHSSARALADVPRNVPDAILERLPANGGVVMVTFVPEYLSPDSTASVATVADHIDHIRDVAGIDHVGIGGDYDGISQEPDGLEDVSTYPVLFAELARRGYSDEEMAKVAGGNILRAMRAAEATATRLQGERGAAVVTIEELDGPAEN